MHRFSFSLQFLAALLSTSPASAEWIWIEGEAPATQQMHRHPWWYDQVKKDQFSGGDFISNFNQDKAGQADYRFTAENAGDFDFWVHANPLSAKLSYSLNGGPLTPIDLTYEKRGETNVAADDKTDLRFIAWSKVGTAKLKQGENTVRFRMDSENSNNGYLDCFVFSDESFIPKGVTKPDAMAGEMERIGAENQSWFAFDPKPDAHPPGIATDLRFLNEKFAGENGAIIAKNGDFIHSKTGEPVRFWAVNGPPHEISTADLKTCARMLAKNGVNLVRVHGGYFDERGEVDPAKVLHAIEMVEVMKAEGIYTHFSIFFPLWLDPKPDNPWLKGYDGKQHSFASLMFNPEFQIQYRKWWTALLTTPSPNTGKRLVDEPAVSSLEMQNEDSFFFWTFNKENIPEVQLSMLEKQFGDWLIKKHGSLEKALAAWKGQKEERDSLAKSRIAFRPLWNIANEKSPRDIDTVAFLLETQTRFYTETHAFLRKLGFKGPITASNWITANPEVLGPLEALSYSVGDFIDRHGYFGCNHKGDNAAWSIRDGHTYSDRSALRFDPEEPGKPKEFFHPAMDIHYNGMPSMISETTWCRPNRYRGEAPLYYAAYGALQHSNAIVHFALDGFRWAVKPGYFMQPWTLMSPAMMGQFPAAALIFRRGLIKPGDVVANVSLNQGDLLALKGTPLPQNAGLDELRLKDVPIGAKASPGQRLNPLLHFVGRANVSFVKTAASTEIADLSPFIDTKGQTLRSTTGELNLDYGKGILTFNAPMAQGASGHLKQSSGIIDTRDLSISSDMEPGHIIVVALDNEPIATSSRMLLQVMSEEKTTGFQTESISPGVNRIISVGTDPWLVRKFSGAVKLKRPDAAKLKVTPLDANGTPLAPSGDASLIKLQSETLYYLISHE